MWDIYLIGYLLAFSTAQATYIPDEPQEYHSTASISEYNGVLPVNKLKSFERVEMSDSEIELSKSLDRSLPSLKSLYVERSTLPPGFFCAFPNLEDLELSNSTVENFKLDELNSLRKLERLVIEGQKITEFNGHALNKLRNLKKLRLRSAKLSTLDRDALVGLDNLEVLDLSWNKLKTIKRQTLKPVRKLRYLWLAYNQLNNFGPEKIVPLPKLDEINLTGNPMTFNAFHNFPGIKELAPFTTIVVATDPPRFLF